MYNYGKDLNTIIHDLRFDFNILIKWFQANKLSLNLTKTKFMIFKPNSKKIDVNESVFKFGTETIQRVKSTQFLGVTLDELLTWNTHIDNICTKISKSIFLLKQTKHMLPKHSLKLLYHCYTQSIINYGLLLWGPMCNKCMFKKVLQLQKKAIRTIEGASYNSPSTPLFKKWKILNLNELLELELGKIVFKYVNKLLPEPLANIFETNNMNHNYFTRYGNYPRIGKHSKLIYNKSFLCKGPSTWINLDESIRNSNNLKHFTHLFKKRLF